MEQVVADLFRGVTGDAGGHAVDLLQRNSGAGPAVHRKERLCHILCNFFDFLFPLFLLKDTPMPAILIECGFLSNSDEAALLSDEVYQCKMALAIIKGLTRYIKSETLI